MTLFQTHSAVVRWPIAYRHNLFADQDRPTDGQQAAHRNWTIFSCLTERRLLNCLYSISRVID